jgi:glycosyltransferase involved in cell wall biosynthesis
MAALHQLVAGFNRGDAISNEALVMRRLFRNWGFDSNIYCEQKRVLPELRGEVRDLNELSASCSDQDTALLHLSIGSCANEVFTTLRGRKVILYHNITPPEYFRWVQPSTAHSLVLGREQAARLAGVADVNLACSLYNAGELRQWGYSDPRVLPLMLDFSALDSVPDRGTIRRFSDGKVNILFVGRCAPNKKIEDVLAAFALFQKAVEPDSRLILAGSFAGTERYQRLLISMARDLRLQEVVFTGAIRQSELNACYRCARVFLCMSEHEGFCIPLIEAMIHRVPVLACAAAAVPETMAGAGVLFFERHFEPVAEMMGRLARDESLRRGVLVRQDERIKAFKGRNLDDELRRLLIPVLPEAG